MIETLHQPSQARRFKLGQAGLVLLMVLLAVAVGLWAWTAIPNRAPAAATQNLGNQAARDKLLGEQVAATPRSLEEILAHPDVIPTHHHPLVGQTAPEFELADSEGKVWKLKELRDGRPVVLIFYYGIHCVNCVRQLGDVNRDLPLFHKVGARVVAVSADPPEATGQWFQQHGPFGFPVLSDPGNSVAEAYGVFMRAQDEKIGDVRRHGIFVIDRHGTVQWANVGFAPFRRNPALLFQLAKWEGSLP